MDTLLKGDDDDDDDDNNNNNNEINNNNNEFVHKRKVYSEWNPTFSASFDQTNEF
jgi:hypothetical protein